MLLIKIITVKLFFIIFKLIQLDPNSSILIISDHLPTLGGHQAIKELGYKYDLYQVPGWFIHKGTFKKLKSTHFYQLLPEILNIQSEGEYCRLNNCHLSKGQLEAQYFQIMQQGTQ